MIAWYYGVGLVANLRLVVDIGYADDIDTKGEFFCLRQAETRLLIPW